MPELRDQGEMLCGTTEVLDANNAGVLWRWVAPRDGRVRRLTTRRTNVWTTLPTFTIITAKGTISPAVLAETNPVQNMTVPNQPASAVKEGDVIQLSCDGAPTAASTFVAQLYIGN